MKTILIANLSCMDCKHWQAKEQLICDNCFSQTFFAPTHAFLRAEFIVGINFYKNAIFALETFQKNLKTAILGS